jgi:hypothetical protein
MEGPCWEVKGTDWQNSTFLSSTHLGPAPEIFFFLSRRGGWHAMLCWRSLHCKRNTSDRQNVDDAAKDVQYLYYFTPLHAAGCFARPPEGRGGAEIHVQGTSGGKTAVELAREAWQPLSTLSSEMHQSQAPQLPLPAPPPARTASRGTSRQNRSLRFAHAESFGGDAGGNRPPNGANVAFVAGLGACRAQTVTGLSTMAPTGPIFPSMTQSRVDRIQTDRSQDCPAEQKSRTAAPGQIWH